jgi:hypothetical protein
MGNLKRIAALVATALLGGCGQGLPRAKPLPIVNQRELGSSLIQGQYESLAGELKSLAGPRRPMVLLFVSDGCLVCRKETRELVDHFAPTGRPVNVSFVSLMVGAIREDALDWQSEFKQPWELGIDQENRLFESLCPELRTPCVLVESDAGVTKFLGEVGLQKLEATTGPWEFSGK